MTLQHPTIVLFDMDGTTVRHLNPKLLHLLEWLDDVSYKITQFLSKLFKKKIKRTPLVATYKGKRRKLLVHRAIHRVRRKEVEQIVEPCPGIYELLDYLKTQNIKIGISSNSLGTGYGHDILETFKLAKYYDSMVFREDINHAKPHPEPLLKTLELLNPTQNDIIWYIGDRQKDVAAALAAQKHLPCPIIPFGYNLHASIAVLKHNIGPDHIVMAWPDLLTKLKELKSK